MSDTGSHIVSQSSTPTSYTTVFARRSLPDTHHHANYHPHNRPHMAPISPVVQTYVASTPVHQPPMIQQFLYVALILSGVGLLWAILAGCGSLSEWYSARKIVADVEVCASLPSRTALSDINAP